MHRLNGFLTSLIFAAHSFTGQDPSANPHELGDRELTALVNSAKHLLESEDLREQSWGAWYAAEHQLEGLAPLARERLKFALKGEKPSAAHVEALCDALIRNHPALSPSEIKRLWEAGFHAIALIFAAYAPEASRPLLSSIVEWDHKEDEPWVSACNLLLRMKSGNLASACLSKMQVDCRIILHCEGDSKMWFDGRRGRAIYWDGFISRNEGWPPAAVYTIILKASTGDILLAEGPEDAFYRRTVHRRSSGIGGRRPLRDRDSYRMECLQSLTASSPVCRDRFAALGLRSSRRVTWTNDDQFEKDIRELRRELRDPWQSFCRALIKEGFLPPDFPDDRFPAIAWKIEDRRPEGQKTPLSPDFPR